MNNKNYRFNKGRKCLKVALSQYSAIKNDVQAYEALGEEEYLQTLQAEHKVRLCSISWSGLPQETWNQETLIVCCVQSWDSLGPTGVAKAPFELQHFFFTIYAHLLCASVKPETHFVLITATKCTKIEIYTRPVGTKNVSRQSKSKAQIRYRRSNFEKNPETTKRCLWWWTWLDN